MLRIEAYTVLDGLSVRVVGTCQGHCGAGGRHEGDAGQILVESEMVERLGWVDALFATLVSLSRERPEVIEFVYH